MKRTNLTTVESLKRGDIVCHKGSGESYIVVDDHGSFGKCAVRTVSVSEPLEWELVEYPDQLLLECRRALEAMLAYGDSKFENNKCMAVGLANEALAKLIRKGA